MGEEEGIPGLLAKLDHRLPEIRDRSMASLTEKLLNPAFRVETLKSLDNHYQYPYMILHYLNDRYDAITTVALRAALRGLACILKDDPKMRQRFLEAGAVGFFEDFATHVHRVNSESEAILDLLVLSGQRPSLRLRPDGETHTPASTTAGFSGDSTAVTSCPVENMSPSEDQWFYDVAVRLKFPRSVDDQYGALGDVSGLLDFPGEFFVARTAVLESLLTVVAKTSDVGVLRACLVRLSDILARIAQSVGTAPLPLAFVKGLLTPLLSLLVTSFARLGSHISAEVTSVICAALDMHAWTFLERLHFADELVRCGVFKHSVSHEQSFPLSAFFVLLRLIAGDQPLSLELESQVDKWLAVVEELDVRVQPFIFRLANRCPHLHVGRLFQAVSDTKAFAASPACVAVGPGIVGCLQALDDKEVWASCFAKILKQDLVTAVHLAAQSPDLARQLIVLIPSALDDDSDDEHVVWTLAASIASVWRDKSLRDEALQLLATLDDSVATWLQMFVQIGQQGLSLMENVRRLFARDPETQRLAKNAVELRIGADLHTPVDGWLISPGRVGASAVAGGALESATLAGIRDGASIVVSENLGAHVRTAALGLLSRQVGNDSASLLALDEEVKKSLITVYLQEETPTELRNQLSDIAGRLLANKDRELVEDLLAVGLERGDVKFLTELAFPPASVCLGSTTGVDRRDILKWQFFTVENDDATVAARSPEFTSREADLIKKIWRVCLHESGDGGNVGWDASPGGDVSDDGARLQMRMSAEETLCPWFECQLPHFVQEWLELDMDDTVGEATVALLENLICLIQRRSTVSSECIFRILHKTLGSAVDGASPGTAELVRTKSLRLLSLLVYRGEDGGRYGGICLAKEGGHELVTESRPVLVSVLYLLSRGVGRIPGDCSSRWLRQLLKSDTPEVKVLAWRVARRSLVDEEIDWFLYEGLEEVERAFSEDNGELAVAVARVLRLCLMQRSDEEVVTRRVMKLVDRGTGRTPLLGEALVELLAGVACKQLAPVLVGHWKTILTQGRPDSLVSLLARLLAGLAAGRERGVMVKTILKVKDATPHLFSAMQQVKLVSADFAELVRFICEVDQPHVAEVARLALEVVERRLRQGVVSDEEFGNICRVLVWIGTKITNNKIPGEKSAVDVAYIVTSVAENLPRPEAVSALCSLARFGVHVGRGRDSWLAAVQRLTMSASGQQSSSDQNQWTAYVRLVGTWLLQTSDDGGASFSDWFGQLWKLCLGDIDRLNELLDLLTVALSQGGLGLASALATVLATATKRTSHALALLARILQVVGLFGADLLTNKAVTGRLVAVLLASHANFSVKRLPRTQDEHDRMEIVFDFVGQLQGCGKTADVFLAKAEELAEIRQTPLFPRAAFIRALLAVAMVEESVVPKRRLCGIPPAVDALLEAAADGNDDASRALKLVEVAGVKVSDRHGSRGE